MSKWVNNLVGGVLKTAAAKSKMTRPEGETFGDEIRRGSQDISETVDAILRKLTSGGLEAEAGFRMARALALTSGSRRDGVKVTLACAANDAEFINLVVMADKARDRHDWSMAEIEYSKALRLYPLHCGYRVQYAHMLKEQDRFDEAELQYREAYALGEMDGELLLHLRFAAAKSGREVNAGTLAGIAAYWGDRTDERPLAPPPVAADVVTLGRLFIDRTAWTPSELNDFLDRYPRQVDVVGAFLKRPEFAQRNRELLAVIVETAEKLA